MSERVLLGLVVETGHSTRGMSLRPMGTESVRRECWDLGGQGVSSSF